MDTEPLQQPLNARHSVLQTTFNKMLQAALKQKNPTIKLLGKFDKHPTNVEDD